MVMSLKELLRKELEARILFLGTVVLLCSLKAYMDKKVGEVDHEYCKVYRLSCTAPHCQMEAPSGALTIARMCPPQLCSRAVILNRTGTTLSSLTVPS